MEKERILLVEDDPNFGSVLRDFLSLQNFETTLAIDGAKGWSMYNQGNFDLVLLDVMLPEIDGFTLANLIIEQNPDQNILFLTARNQKEDMLRGFKLGASDYVTKPFDSEILTYRIKAILKRKESLQKASIENLKIGEFTLESDSRTLSIGTDKIKLSPKEAELLSMLGSNLNKTIERDIVLKQIWAEDTYFTARSMDVYLSKLRKHLSKDSNLKLETIHGKGFKLVLNS
jgi:two-component system, OmpR family, response regulator